MKRTSLTAIVGTALALSLVLVGCGKDDSSTGSGGTKAATPTLSDAWVRSVQGQGAAYVTITGGTEADVLTKVSVPSSVAKEAQLHETTMGMDSGMGGSSTTAMGGTGGTPMEMKPITKIDIPAGATVQLKPGGFHIMLVDVATPLAAGDTVPLTFTFEKAGTRTIDAKVRAL